MYYYRDWKLYACSELDKRVFGVSVTRTLFVCLLSIADRVIKQWRRSILRSGGQCIGRRVAASVQVLCAGNVSHHVQDVLRKDNVLSAKRRAAIT